jgi:phospholipid/cholesterol/gamma-HCH transport system permease protein
MEQILKIPDNAAIAIGRYTRIQFHLWLEFVGFMRDLLKKAPLIYQNFHVTLEQMYSIGITSIPLVVTTSVFTGAVTAWQMAYQFADMIPLTYVGMAVGKSVMLEMGPMLTAMVMAGRIGAAMCSELGTMAVTEQIDAMKCLGLDPYKHLLAPRLMASIFMLPVLTILSAFVAIMGGFLVSYLAKDITWDMFFYGVRLFYSDWDMVVGLIKSVIFGGTIASFACFFGYNARNGAEGVGKATKATVVASMTCILIFGFLVSKLLLI